MSMNRRLIRTCVAIGRTRRHSDVRDRARGRAHHVARGARPSSRAPCPPVAATRSRRSSRRCPATPRPATTSSATSRSAVQVALAQLPAPSRPAPTTPAPPSGRPARRPTTSAGARPAAGAAWTRSCPPTASAPASRGAGCPRRAVRAGMSAPLLAQFAELVFAYIDELSAASVAGHADELATAERVQQRQLERLALDLLRGASDELVTRRAERAEWALPPDGHGAARAGRPSCTRSATLVDGRSLRPDRGRARTSTPARTTWQR